MSRKYDNREWMTEHYINQNWTLQDIVDECGISPMVAWRWANKFGLKKRGFTPNKEWLYHEYIVKNRTRTDIARELGKSPSTIKNRLHYFGIKKKK